MQNKKISPATRRWQVVLITVCLFAGGCTSNKSSRTDATIYSTKQIITMDVNQPTSSAVAVAEGRIIAVGDLPSVRKATRDYNVKHNRQFANQVLMPGLIENHLHPTLAGILLPSVFITPWDWELPNQSVSGVQSRPEYIAALTDSLEQHTSDEVFITWGYHHYFHGELSRSDLDSLAPDIPVIVWHRSFHEVILNSAAIKVLNIDEAALKTHPAIDLEKGHF